MGALGLAVGLALQGSLANFAGGVLLLVFKPFKVGDLIESCGQTGHVQEIQIFNTIMHTYDNVKIIIPNSQVISGIVMNYVATGTRRVDLKVSVAYREDIDKVRVVIASVLADEKRVLAEPVAVIAVGELGESSINFFVRPWVRSADYWDVYFALTENFKKAFDAHGITMPFRQMDVFIKNSEILTAQKITKVL